MSSVCICMLTMNTFRFQYTIDQHPWKGLIPLDTDILVTHTPPV